MEIARTHVVAYSPCSHTKKVALAVARGIGAPSRLCNLTRPGSTPPADVALDELVVLAAPVHNQTIPKDFAKRLEGLSATFSAAVLVVTYGNRTFGSAVADLAAVARARGLHPIAAIVAPVQHSMFSEVAEGRPDAADLERYAQLAEVARHKLDFLKSPVETNELTLPAQPRETPVLENGFKAVADATRCVRCGTCSAICPTGSIPYEQPTLTNSRTCTACMACVTYCPVACRSLKPPKRYEKARELALEVARERQEPQLFV